MLAACKTLAKRRRGKDESRQSSPDACATHSRQIEWTVSLPLKNKQSRRLSLWPLRLEHCSSVLIK